MSDRVRLQPGRDVRDAPISLAGTRPQQIPQASPPSSRMTPGMDGGEALATLAGQVMGFVGERMGKQEMERAVMAARAEPLQRDGQNNLVVPDMEQSFFDTATDEAVRAVRVSRYGSEWVLGQQKALVDLRAANQTPEAFAAAAGKWRDATAQQAPAAIRGVVSQQIDKMIGEHGANLAERSFREARAASIESAGQLIAGWTTEADNLIRGGRHADAHALDGPITRAVAKTRELVATGVLPAEIGVKMEREISITTPIIADVMRRVSARGAEGGHVADALKTGPTHAAWDPTWAFLTTAERDSAGRMALALVQSRRGEQAHARGEGQRDAMRQQAGIAFRLDEISRSLAADIDAGGTGRPSPAQAAEIARLSSRARLLSEEHGDTRGLAAQGAEQGLRDQVGRAALDQDRLDRSMAILAEAQLVNPEVKGRVEQLWQGTQGLSIHHRADLFAREASEQAGHLRVQTQAIASEAAWVNALDSNSPKVPNNAQNQTIAWNHIRRTLSAPVAEGAAAPSQIDVTVQAVRAGAFPQPIINMLRTAIETGRSLETAAAMAEKMERDPVAAEVYRAAVPDNIRAALLGSSAALSVLRVDNSKDAQTRESIRSDMLARMLGQKVPNSEAVLALLGSTKPKQDEALAEAIKGGWKLHELEKGGTFWVGSMEMNPRMQAQMEALTLANMRNGSTPVLAAKDAARQVHQGWMVTKMALPMDTAGAGAQQGIIERFVGRNTGETISWMNAPGFAVPRTQAPENYPALWGRVNSDKGANTDWIADRLPTMVEQGGGTKASVEGLTLYSQLRLMPVPNADGKFFVWKVGRLGIFTPVWRVLDGVETSRPVVVDLATNAKRLNDDFGKRRLDYETERRLNRDATGYDEQGGISRRLMRSQSSNDRPLPGGP